MTEEELEKQLNELLEKLQEEEPKVHIPDTLTAHLWARMLAALLPTGGAEVGDDHTLSTQDMVLAIDATNKIAPPMKDVALAYTLSKRLTQYAQMLSAKTPLGDDEVLAALFTAFYETAGMMWSAGYIYGHVDMAVLQSGKLEGDSFKRDYGRQVEVVVGIDDEEQETDIGYGIGVDATVSFTGARLKEAYNKQEWEELFGRRDNTTGNK